MLARVLWFCNTSGEGMLSLEDGTTAYCHWSAVQPTTPKNPKNGKKHWVELEPGWIGRVEILSDDHWRQVSKFTVTKKAKPIKTESFFIERNEMKAKLAACEASFDELRPDFKEFDLLYELNRKIDHSKKDLKKIEELNEKRKIHDSKMKKWNENRSDMILKIYREHDRFYLNRRDAK